MRAARIPSAIPTRIAAAVETPVNLISFKDRASGLLFNIFSRYILTVQILSITLLQTHNKLGEPWLKKLGTMYHAGFGLRIR
jgi:hypothetical protein